jgi:hypothetical protein
MTCTDKTKGMSYTQAMNWLEWMSKRYDQHQCEKCGLWHIYTRKLASPPTKAKEEGAE